MPMTWFQALNPLFVFALTPLLLAWWRRRAETATSQSPAIGRMALGAALVGASYVMLAVLTKTSQGQPVAWPWLVAFFALLTMGELYFLTNVIGLTLLWGR